jgi:Ca2+-binding RTX toxin-like protein
LSASAFTTGVAATSANHRIIFDNLSGALLYDADGSGAGVAVQFATLTGLSGLLTNEEFLII